MFKTRSLFALAATAALAALANQSFANTVATVTVNNATQKGTAVITLNNGSLTVTITNDLDNPADAGSLIGGIKFTISPTPITGAASNFAGTGTLINVDSNGNITNTTPGANLITADAQHPWTVNVGTSNNVYYDQINIGGANPGGPVPLIIGNPGTSGTYTGNGSIGGAAHDLFVKKTATFTVDINGLSADANITSAWLMFGTTYTLVTGTITPPDGGGGEGNSAPLPAAAVGGMGLIAALGVGSALRKKIRRA